MASGEYGAVDVTREIVVIDEYPDAGVSGCSIREDVESEVECSVFGDVVIRWGVSRCDPGNATAISRFDDGPETAAHVAIGPIGGDVVISMMCPGRMGDVGGGRFVE